MSDKTFELLIIGIFVGIPALCIFIGIINAIIAGSERSTRKAYHDQIAREFVAMGFVAERIYKRPEKLKHSTKPLLYNYLAFDFTRNSFIFENWKCELKDVVAVELIKDSSVVQSASARQDGWSVSGGIVPGMGMITGSAQMNSSEKSSMIAVSVILNCTNLPSVLIPFLFSITEKASEEYQTAVIKAYEVYSIFESAVRRNKK